MFLVCLGGWHAIWSWGSGGLPGASPHKSKPPGSPRSCNHILCPGVPTANCTCKQALMTACTPPPQLPPAPAWAWQSICACTHFSALPALPLLAADTDGECITALRRTKRAASTQRSLPAEHSAGWSQPVHTIIVQLLGCSAKVGECQGKCNNRAYGPLLHIMLTPHRYQLLLLLQVGKYQFKCSLGTHPMRMRSFLLSSISTGPKFKRIASLLCNTCKEIQELQLKTRLHGLLIHACPLIFMHAH